MRLFIAIILLFCGCSPYFDLRHPIYMVTENSFWSGCDKDPSGATSCRAFRVKQVNAGVNQWFKYFDKKNPPMVFVVFSANDLPNHLVNEIIYLKIIPGICGKGHIACYRVPKLFSVDRSIDIVFDQSEWIKENIVAHECGHFLDLDHSKNLSSVMFFIPNYPVSVEDLINACSLHPECRLKPK